MERVVLGAVLALLLTAAPASPGVPQSAWQDLHWRLLGPFRAGWATAVAGVPGDPTTFYFGGADGGVFVTHDAGRTWQPIFEREGSASIGALAVAPSDPRTLWVGTGQVHQRFDVTSGDGVYVSMDAGVTWRHAGLAATRHIGDVWVDPRDARVAVVAALDHVFGPNPERGVYRTEDGGLRWAHVLDRGPGVGAVDIDGDPTHPDILYASTWEVRRWPWLDYFVPPVGTGSGIHRSTDGGRTWTALAGRGLPPGPLGRISLEVVPGTAARSVLAAIDAEPVGGLYRSDDAGASWTLVNATKNLGSSYMSGIVVHPQEPGVVWAMGRSLRRSTDGGRTFHAFKGAPGGDDYHALWIDPTDPRRRITGADQGAIVTLNGGRTWSSWYNQPTGQFYRLAADDRFPYRVYAGQQDNGTVAIASRSDYGRLTFRDWHPVGGDERDGDVPDPRDPDIVYGAGLGGRVTRFDARTGQVRYVSPWPASSYARQPTTVRERYGWITPIAIAKRPPYTLYVGSQRLHRSQDGGSTWSVASGDLTGAIPGTPDCGGNVPVARATACGFGVIWTIAPSPVADGVVWVGTTNGRVALTRDDGATWTDVTPPALADWSKVNTIDLSAHEPGTAYLAADRQRLDDPRPIVWRTRDFGATWTELGRGLPQDEWVGVVRQDPVVPALLYAGTNRGVHVSFDDGASWQSLQLELPRSGINDLLVHRDDVIVATQGRALWVLDQVTPLRHLARTGADAPALVAPATAVRWRGNHNVDTPLPLDEPTAANPPAGLVVDYLLPASPVGRVVLEILGDDGSVLRRFASDEAPAPSAAPAEVYFTQDWLLPPQVPSARAGHNRFVWDLRLARPRCLEPEYGTTAAPGATRPEPGGALVAPGRYRVRLTAGEQQVVQPFEVVADPRVGLAAEDYAALAAFEREVEAVIARSADLAAARKAGRATTTDAVPAAPDDPAEDSPERVNAVLSALAADLEAVDAPPTAAQRAVFAAYRDGLLRWAARRR